MENLTDYIVVDSKTGEYVQNLTRKETLMLEKNYTSMSKTNNTNMIPKKNLFNEMIDKLCGNFCFSFYDEVMKLENAYLFRFIYLSTYINYKGYVEFGNAKGVNKLIKKNDIKEILNLKRTEAYNTIKYFEDNNLLTYDEDNYVKINPAISKRGKLINKENESKHTRIFDTYIQELYSQCSTKEHKALGLMLKLLPYIHFKTNIICSNPNEVSCEKIKPLKLMEILNIISASKTTIKTLMNFKIMNGTESAFLKSSNAFIKNFYIVNPRITYRGVASSVDENNVFLLEQSLSYFKIGSI